MNVSLLLPSSEGWGGPHFPLCREPQSSSAAHSHIWVCSHPHTRYCSRHWTLPQELPNQHATNMPKQLLSLEHTQLVCNVILKYCGDWREHRPRVWRCLYKLLRVSPAVSGSSMKKTVFIKAPEDLFKYFNTVERCFFINNIVYEMVIHSILKCSFSSRVQILLGLLTCQIVEK